MVNKYVGVVIGLLHVNYTGTVMLTTFSSGPVITTCVLQLIDRIQCSNKPTLNNTQNCSTLYRTNK